MFDVITSVMDQAGYAGIVLLMFLENLFPPLPSELIMPMAGFIAAAGGLTLPGAVIAGVLGSVMGALPWYWLGRVLGTERLREWLGKHGRWLTLTPRGLDRANAWFERHCGKAVFFGRLAPAVRTLVSVPAGIFRMDLGRFLLFTALGSAVWCTVLAAAGYLLQDGYDRVERYVGPVSNGIVALLLLTYLYRLLTWRPRATD